MLDRSMTDGSALLIRLARAAVARLLADPSSLHTTRLFTDDERDELGAELAAVQATANLLSRSLVSDHANRVRRRRQVRTTEGLSSVLAVPVQLQDTDYTCGAACLQAVCDYHGLERSEAQLARLLGTTPEDGTSPQALERLARALGLETEARHNATLEDLAWSIRHNAPVICLVRCETTGHFVVATGVEGDQVHLMDPLKGLTSVSAEEFTAGWWDESGGKRWDRYALAVGAPLQESRLHRMLEGAPVQALAPDDALAFFRSLLPLLGTDPQRVLPDLRRTAFTLAAATEQELLQAVQQTIADRLASGEVGTGARAVQQVLDRAGVSSSNPAYAETVFRTNAMDSYNQGLQDQLAEEAETFPVWRYSNPGDSRSRPLHAQRSGNYYPTTIPFNRVRGTDRADVMNCRCTAIPIDRWEWTELKARGAKIADGYPDVAGA